MAGIAFELKNLLKKKKLTSILYAFSYATFLSAGPWIISIVSIIIAGIVAKIAGANPENIRKFQIIVTYITAFSLILSSPFQLLFTRYAADRIFKNERHKILPNFLGVLILNLLVGLIFGIIFSIFTMRNFNIYFIALFILSLSLMTGFWITNTLLTSFKSYKYILFSFFTGFLIMIIISFLYGKEGINTLLLSFYVGIAVIFLFLTGYIFKNFKSTYLIDFEFLNRKKVFFSLSLVGFFYNFAIWIDKFIFWFSKTTGESVIGPFHASIVYDIPIFLAYLIISPGMGIFFLKLESEFANHYDRYYTAVREGETLDRIYELGYELAIAVRTLIQETFRIQGIAVVIIFLTEIFLFKILGFSLLYIPLFNVLVLGTYLQLMVMTVLAILFYFDLRFYALITTFTFAVLNTVLSYFSIILGPYFYGYGFFLSLLISFLVGLFLLRRFLNEIHYRTFMLI